MKVNSILTNVVGLEKKTSGVEKVISFMREQEDKTDRKHHKPNNLIATLLNTLKEKYVIAAMVSFKALLQSLIDFQYQAKEFFFTSS